MRKKTPELRISFRCSTQSRRSTVTRVGDLITKTTGRIRRKTLQHGYASDSQLQGLPAELSNVPSYHKKHPAPSAANSQLCHAAQTLRNSVTRRLKPALACTEQHLADHGSQTPRLGRDSAPKGNLCKRRLLPEITNFSNARYKQPISHILTIPPKTPAQLAPSTVAAGPAATHRQTLRFHPAQTSQPHLLTDYVPTLRSQTSAPRQDERIHHLTDEHPQRCSLLPSFCATQVAAM